MVEKKFTGEHAVHICELASQNKHEEITKLVKSPNYQCFNCGRVADLEKSLCYPIKFDEIPAFKKMYVTK